MASTKPTTFIIYLVAHNRSVFNIYVILKNQFHFEENDFDFCNPAVVWRGIIATLHQNTSLSSETNKE